MKTLVIVLTFVLAGCSSIIPQEVARSTLDPHQAYVEQFVDKQSSLSFLICHARYFDVVDGEHLAKRIKLDGRIHDLVPAGERKLFVEVVYSSPTLVRAAGEASFQLPASLEAGTYYEFECRRDGDTFTVLLKQKNTAKIVSQKITFDAKNPIIIPIPL